MKPSQVELLYRYMTANRRVGHTRLMREGIDNYDKPFFVLGVDQQHTHNLMKDVMNDKAIPITLENFDKHMRGVDYPVAIDNYAFTSTFLGFQSHINYLDQEVLQLKRELTNKSMELVNYQVEVESFNLWKRVFGFKKRLKKIEYYEA